MTNAVNVTALNKSFGAPNNQKTILENLEFSLEQGRSLVIVGGSGTGKSVLLKCLLGLLKPDAGSIKIFGDSIDNSVDRMSMLFQAGALFDSLTIWENIAFKGLFGTGVLKNGARRISRSEAKTLAKAKLKDVDLDATVADLYPSELSGGMQKRAALARAVAFEPELVFFDEPTTGLDPVRAAQINDLIARLVKNLGASTITITHDMSSATTIADEVALLKAGSFVWKGAPTELFTADQPDLRAFIDPITKQTMGTSMPTSPAHEGTTL